MDTPRFSQEVTEMLQAGAGLVGRETPFADQREALQAITVMTTIHGIYSEWSSDDAPAGLQECVAAALIAITSAVEIRLEKMRSA